MQYSSCRSTRIVLSNCTQQELYHKHNSCQSTRIILQTITRENQINLPIYNCKQYSMGPEEVPKPFHCAYMVVNLADGPHGRRLHPRLAKTQDCTATEANNCTAVYMTEFSHARGNQLVFLII